MLIGRAFKCMTPRTLAECRLKPLGAKIVVSLVDKSDRTPGGIYLPDQAQKKPTEGIVIAVGSGKKLDNGELHIPSVQVGETVLFSKYGGSEVTVDGTDYTILDEDQIYAVLNPL